MMNINIPTFFRMLVNAKKEQLVMDHYSFFSKVFLI